MALTKTAITDKLQERLNLSGPEAYDLMENLLEIMKETMESGDDLLISGFGKFCVNEKKARKGRNPATNAAMTLPKRKIVTFKCSGKLRDRINNS